MISPTKASSRVQVLATETFCLHRVIVMFSVIARVIVIVRVNMF